MEKGQPLAARCSGFDYAVQNLTQAASVPIIPVTGARFVSVLVTCSQRAALLTGAQTCRCGVDHKQTTSCLYSVCLPEELLDG